MTGYQVGYEIGTVLGIVLWGLAIGTVLVQARRIQRLKAVAVAAAPSSVQRVGIPSVRVVAAEPQREKRQHPVVTVFYFVLSAFAALVIGALVTGVISGLSSSVNNAANGAEPVSFDGGVIDPASIPSE